jgi:hypothetical protein
MTFKHKFINVFYIHRIETEIFFETERDSEFLYLSSLW